VPELWTLDHTVLDILVIIALSVLEVAALYTIARLWLRRRLRIVPRIFWSAVLLVPLFGLLMYVFIVSDLDQNPSREDGQGESDAFYFGGDGR
jgi:hypothetical protein